MRPFHAVGRKWVRGTLADSIQTMSPYVCDKVLLMTPFPVHQWLLGPTLGSGGWEVGHITLLREA